MSNAYHHIAITEITMRPNDVLPPVGNDPTAASWQSHWCAIQQELQDFHAEFTVVCVVKVGAAEMVVQVRTAAQTQTRDMYWDIIVEEHAEIVEHCLRQGAAGGSAVPTVLFEATQPTE